MLSCTLVKLRKSWWPTSDAAASVTAARSIARGSSQQPTAHAAHLPSAREADGQSNGNRSAFTQAHAHAQTQARTRAQTQTQLRTQARSRSPPSRRAMLLEVGTNVQL